MVSVIGNAIQRQSADRSRCRIYDYTGYRSILFSTQTRQVLASFSEMPIEFEANELEELNNYFYNCCNDLASFDEFEPVFEVRKVPLGL